MDSYQNIQSSYSTEPDRDQIYTQSQRPGIEIRIKEYENVREAIFDLSFLDLKIVKSVAQLKYFNITQATKVFHDKTKQKYFLEEKLLPYQPLVNNIVYDNLNDRIEIILELCLTMAEFAKRGLAWNNLTLEAIGLFEGHVMIDKFLYDFQSKPNEELSLQNFKKFIMQYFQNFGRRIQNLISYEAIVNEALGLFPDLSKPDCRFPPYLRILEKIFQFKLEDMISQYGSNSYVYKVNIPSIIGKKFHKILDEQSHIVIKSTIIQQNQDQEVIKQTLLNIDREIELSEELPLNSCFASAFTYIRIGKQSYLFMHYYPQTLSDYLFKLKNKKVPPPDQVQVYKIAKSIAEAIKHMHDREIMHRDLKPGNIFLTNEDIGQSFLHIADFDRSKIQDQESIMETTSCNTAPYDPPEVARGKQFETLKIDIWQFGLIMVEVANHGEYYGNQSGSYFVSKYETVYGPEKINNLLAKYQYKQEFLDLINSCLQENPQDRPDGLKIFEIAYSLKRKSSILQSRVSISPTYPQQRNSITNVDGLQQQQSRRKITLVSMKITHCNNNNNILRQQTQ